MQIYVKIEVNLQK